MSASLSFFGVLVLNLLLGVNSQWAFNPPKREGIVCGQRGAEVWTCRREAQCPGLRKLVQSGNRVICSKGGGLVTVCCPPTPPVTSISQKKCLEYQASATCMNRPNLLLWSSSGPRLPPFPDAVPEESITGVLEEEYLEPTDQYASLGSSTIGQTEDPLEDDFTEAPGGSDGATPVLGILGGEEALSGEHPHMALIGFGTRNNIQWKCGGTLISEWFVLSAAHCETSNYGRATVVRLGDLDYKSSEDNTNAQEYQIVESYVHENYNNPNFYNDIVLYKLEQEVFFTEFVAPACLHRDTPKTNSLVTATGYGRVEPQLEKSILMKVNLTLLGTDKCADIYNSTVRKTNLRSGIDGRIMICALDEGKDTCPGDSGGPLVIANKGDNCLHQLVGITSFGPSICEPTDIPGVYVRVQSFIPWIESIVWADEA